MQKKVKNHKVLLAIIACIIIAGCAVWLASQIITTSGGITANQIAVIPIKGVISVYGSTGLFESGGAASQEIVKQIEKADEDLAVKAIILEINSPGGTVVGCREIASAIRTAQKPSVGWIREQGTSGGYWVASATDAIVADPASITGSIGVSGSYLQFAGLLEEYGIGYERLVSGKYKDTGSPYREPSEEERELLLAKINKIKEFFVGEIAQNRGLNYSDAEALATGEIFLGSEAADLGLVDILGGRDEAKAQAEALAGIIESKLVRYERKPSFWESIGSLFFGRAYWLGRGIGDSYTLLAEEEVVLLAI